MRVFYNSAGGFQSIGYTLDGRVLTLDNRARLASWDINSPRPDRIRTEASVCASATLKGLRSARGRVGILIHFADETPTELLRFDLATRWELIPWSNPDSDRIVEVSEDGTLVLVNEEGRFRWRLWELETNKPLKEYFDLPHWSPLEPTYTPLLAPDNSRFVMTVITDKRLLLWHRGNPKPQQLIRPGRAQHRRGTHYYFLAFSSDSRFLVGAQLVQNGLVTVWDLPDGTVRWSLPQEKFVWALAVHPSGKIVAVATDGGSAGHVVRFLDTATGDEITRFNWNASRIRCLAFSPDGLTCAAGCSDRRLVVWDVDL